MSHYPPRPQLKLIRSSNLEYLHDQIITSLDLPEKAGITELLNQNNKVFKKEIFKFLQNSEPDNISELMFALDSLLDIHARECYTIGYLDCVGGKRSNSMTKGKK